MNSGHFVSCSSRFWKILFQVRVGFGSGNLISGQYHIRFELVQVQNDFVLVWFGSILVRVGFGYNFGQFIVGVGHVRIR